MFPNSGVQNVPGILSSSCLWRSWNAILENQLAVTCLQLRLQYTQCPAFAGSAHTLVVEVGHLRPGVTWLEDYCVSSPSLMLVDIVLLGCDRLQGNIDHKLNVYQTVAWFLKSIKMSLWVTLWFRWVLCKTESSESFKKFKKKKLLAEAVAFTVWRWKIISCGSSCRK